MRFEISGEDQSSCPMSDAPEHRLLVRFTHDYIHTLYRSISGNDELTPVSMHSIRTWDPHKAGYRQKLSSGTSRDISLVVDCASRSSVSQREQMLVDSGLSVPARLDFVWFTPKLVNSDHELVWRKADNVVWIAAPAGSRVTVRAGSSEVTRDK